MFFASCGRAARSRFAFVVLAVLGGAAAAGAVASTEHGPQAAPAQAATRPSPPLAFEANRGQAPSGVDFVARGAGYAVSLDGGAARLALSHRGGAAVVAVRVVGARAAKAVPERRLPGSANYLVGGRSHWLTGVPTFAGVRYPRVLPGVDLAFHGRGRQLEYDFHLAPGTDPGSIRLAFAGTRPRVDGGALVLPLRGGAVTQPAPQAWQTVAGVRRPVAVGYHTLAGGRIGFVVGAYDHARPLLIDPVLAYSTYLGGIGDDDPYGIAVDAAGSAYVVGSTPSADFPTAGALKGTLGSGDRDAFVTKLSPDGSAVVYSTYLGGSASAETAYDVAVDSAGSAYVTGDTMSADFPTANAFDAHFDGPSDAFVSKLSPSGSSLVYSTFLGGATATDPSVYGAYDHGYGIAVDAAGAAYVTGVTQSADFPTVGALQSSPGRGTAAISDAFVTKLAPSGSSLAYSTYLGGSEGDSGNGIAVDAAGEAVVVGSTSSSDFPTAKPLQSFRGSDAFVSKLAADGSSFVYSTYLGGEGEDAADAVALDSAGNAYVTGSTQSNQFPTTKGAFATACAAGTQYCGYGADDAFVSKLTADGSALAYSTYFGAMGRDLASGIAVNGRGEATFVGSTGALPADGFPVVDAFQPSFGGGIDGYVARLAADGGSLVFSSYLGGNWYDVPSDAAAGPSDDDTYVTGSTNSTNFTTTPGAYDRTGGETCADTGRCDDAFVVKVGPGQAGVADTTPPTVAITAPASASIVRGQVTISATVSDDTSVRQVEFLVNGQTVGYDPYAPYEATWYTTQTPDGPATVTVQASDPAGNVGVSKPVQVVVDNAPPETSIGDAPTGTVTSTAATISFASSEPSSTFSCSLDGGKSTACSSPVSYKSLTGGPHTFAVTATDAAGTKDPSAAQATWTVFNDAFATPWPLSGASGTVTGSTDGATAEPGEPKHAKSGGASVWFTWTAPAGGTAVFDTDGSGFDTILAVYTGTAVTKLTEVAANNNYRGRSARVTFAAEAGTEYRIALDGKNGRTGAYTLSWSESK